MSAAALLALLASERQDVLGGGFFEEGSTEKTLQTNTRMLEQLTNEGLRSADQELLRAARLTGDYLVRDLQSPDGAFWAGESGDLEDFYTWTCAEARLAHPHVDCTSLGLDELDRIPRGGDDATRHALFLARLERLPPATDTTVDLQANTQAVLTLARSGSLLGYAHWVRAAERAAVDLELRGEATLALHQASGRLDWLEKAGGPPRTGTVALVVADWGDPARDVFRQAVLNQASDALVLVTVTPSELPDLSGFELPSPATAQLCYDRLCEPGTDQLQSWVETLESMR